MLRRLRQWLRSLTAGAEPPPDAVRRADEPPPAAATIEILQHDVHFYPALPAPQRDRLHRLVAQFLDEKEFWGSQNLAVTIEMKVYIAAHACLMVLGLPRLGLYPTAREVIVFPSHFGESIECIAPDGRTIVIDDKHVGQTWRRGPVLLSWDDIDPAARVPMMGHNTIYHEYAHVLDMMDGEADGVPPLESTDQLAAWQRVLGDEYRSLVAADRAGRRSFLDPYGAQDPAEFFAVATEQFFEQPRRFQRLHRALYGQLRQFYKQDPAAWMGG
jgi:Mlc titration factor MtfA (ptsG expression regulator)